MNQQHCRMAFPIGYIAERARGNCEATLRGDNAAMRRVAVSARTFVLLPHLLLPVGSPVSLVDGGSMPDVSYSTLANWDGRLSAPGSVNGDEILSGSRSSPNPPSASPRGDPVPNGTSHAHIASTVVAEKGGATDTPNVVAERTERGMGSASEKVRRRANSLLRSLQGIRDNDR